MGDTILSLGLTEGNRSEISANPAAAGLADAIKAATIAIEERGNHGRSTASLSDAENAERLELLHAAQKLVTSLENPEKAVLEVAKGPAAHAILRTALRLNLFDFIGHNEATSADNLALSVKIDKVLAVRIMRTLVSIGIFNEIEENTYSHNPRSQALTHPAFRTFVSGLSETTTIMSHLPDFLSSLAYANPADRHNALFQYANNTHLNLFEWIKHHPEQLARFSATMSAATKLQAPHLEATLLAVLSQIDDNVDEDEQRVLLVDIGGGRGDILPSVRTKLPNLRGRLIVQDLSQEIEARAPVAGIEAMAYDFFTLQPVNGAHIYYFCHILHDWPDAACRHILRNTIPALQAGRSRIVIVDLVVSEVGAAAFACLMDVSMMVYGGMERTESQWRALLGSVGLKVVRIEGPREGSLTGDGVIEAELGG